MGDVVNGNRTFATSSMVLLTPRRPSASAVGGNRGGTKAAATTTLGWTPSAFATDLAGNGASTATIGESGGLDTDF